MSDNPLGEVRVGADGYDLVFVRRLTKSVDKVWAALTVPERIADWLAVAEIDLRIGGRFELYWPAHNFRMRGVITELQAPRRIAWTWPHQNHPHSVVRWTLDPDGAGCRLTLSQSGLSDPSLVDVAAGWHTHLEGLPLAIDGRNAPWRGEREQEIRALYQASSRP